MCGGREGEEDTLPETLPVIILAKDPDPRPPTKCAGPFVSFVVSASMPQQLKGSPLTLPHPTNFESAVSTMRVRSLLRRISDPHYMLTPKHSLRKLRILWKVEKTPPKCAESLVDTDQRQPASITTFQPPTHHPRRTLKVS